MNHSSTFSFVSLYQTTERMVLIKCLLLVDTSLAQKLSLQLSPFETGSYHPHKVNSVPNRLYYKYNDFHKRINHFDASAVTSLVHLLALSSSS